MCLAGGFGVRRLGCDLGLGDVSPHSKDALAVAEDQQGVRSETLWRIFQSLSVQGLKTLTPSGAKSEMLRVATVQPREEAVAAIIVSRISISSPCLIAALVIRPHSKASASPKSATGIVKTSAKNNCKSGVGLFSTPCAISAKSLIKNREWCCFRGNG